MNEHPRSAAPLTRRDAMKRAAALATLGAGSVLTGGGSATAATPRPEPTAPGDSDQRVAIIGAGAGGVAAAYFLGGSFDVDLFEARSKIGGHCDTHVIDDDGQSVTVDLGAQFFHPDTHPIYVTLLEQLGLYDPADPDAGETFQAPGSLCIFPIAGGPPIFSSSHPLATLLRSLEFARYTRLARGAVLSDMSWEITVGAWVRSLTVSEAFKSEVVLPWTTALIGCPRADALRASARSILQTFALAFPADPLAGATTYTSKIGLQGNLQRLLDRAQSVQVHLNAPTQVLTRTAAGWVLQTPFGWHGPYGAVVLNAPPLTGRRLVRTLPGFTDVAALLDVYEYFDSRVLIHTDPAYMESDRDDWAAYNAGVDGRQCEGSVWYGALDPPLASGATIDVFKSWAERRPADPTQILLERRYQHPLISRSTIRAARSLQSLQGRDGLYFSGQYTTGFDSQESAVYSAMKVAESLAPGSPTLTSLTARLAANGLSGISYSL